MLSFSVNEEEPYLTGIRTHVKRHFCPKTPQTKRKLVFGSFLPFPLMVPLTLLIWFFNLTLIFQPLGGKLTGQHSFSSRVAPQLLT